MLELYEVENGNERQFFRTKETAKDMADWLFDHQVDGIVVTAKFHDLFALRAAWGEGYWPGRISMFRTRTAG